MTCKLCEEDKPLIKSHIFPEWLYASLYDDKQRFFVLSTNKNKKRGTRPKGIYEKLLCRECEQRLGKWEGYARNVFCGNDPRVKVQDFQDRLVISGLQYDPFKLFQMSLIWRASITNRPELHRINLGPHAERLRKMLIEEFPGESYQYGAIIMSLPRSQDQIMRELIYPPERLPNKIDGHTAYRAILGGLFWLFLVSSHSADLPYNDLFISENGLLPIFEVGGPAIRFMEKLALDFRKAGMLNEPA